MIIFEAPHLEAMRKAAEAAYPREACGLIVGSGVGGQWQVLRIAASDNVAPAAARDRFEIDPRLRLQLQRELRDGSDRVIGHYHSHPNAPAAPSATDRASVWEPDLIWVIVSVRAGHAAEITAHQVVGAGDTAHFEQINVHLSGPTAA